MTTWTPPLHRPLRWRFQRLICDFLGHKVVEIPFLNAEVCTRCSAERDVR